MEPCTPIQLPVATKKLFPMLAEIGRRNDKTYRICHLGNPANRGVPSP
jgi:hypothetical protein